MSHIDYEIESRSDFLTGMYLIARIPDSDLDENALHTIQEDCPDFILPFNYKSINGQTEFTYKVGTLSKLQYFYGDISHLEYIALWKGLLSPLLECRDWFMNPCSFVLSADHLYYDKNKKTVSYIYIPSIRGCSGHEAFNDMAISIAKSIKVSDPALENKVLRSIINDFDPSDFLKMLLKHLEPEKTQMPDLGPRECISEPWDDEDDLDEQGISYEDIPGASEERLARRCTQEDAEQSVRQDNKRESDGYKIFGRKGKRGDTAKRNGFRNTVPNNLPMPALPKNAGSGDVTQETKTVMSGTGFRCVGRANLPQVIEVGITKGEIFTIGRYDVNAGKKRSSFEFEAKTKAVSRRHAAIEYDGSAYKIVDLSSSAGTFVNDRKLPPNTPTALESGCRVSFGNLGADYVWDVG